MTASMSKTLASICSKSLSAAKVLFCIHSAPSGRESRVRAGLMTTHFFWFYLALTAARAFYLPGVAPREYKSGEKVELKARPDVLRSIPNRDGEPCLTGLQI